LVDIWGGVVLAVVEAIFVRILRNHQRMTGPDRSLVVKQKSSARWLRAKLGKRLFDHLSRRTPSLLTDLSDRCGGDKTSRIFCKMGHWFLLR
jgi:hypothetical protein